MQCEQKLVHTSRLHCLLMSVPFLQIQIPGATNGCEDAFDSVTTNFYHDSDNLSRPLFIHSAGWGASPAGVIGPDDFCLE